MLEQLHNVNIIIFLLYKSTMGMSKSCNVPDLPMNTEQITGQKLVYPDQVNLHYKCNDGYFFSSGQAEHKIRCNEGIWEPKAMWKCADKCKNTCGSHGKCAATLMINGSRSSWKCECDINWAGDKCNSQVCDGPLLSDHGTVRLINGYKDVASGKYQLGSLIQFGCETGYSIYKGSTKAYCRRDVGWHHPIPVCEMVSCSSMDFKHGSFSPMLVSYKASDTVSFTCSKGYSLNLPNGQHDVTCHQQGFWGPYWPKCVETLCPAPLTIQHGIKELNTVKFIVGSYVKYSCNIGYVLVGDAAVHCVEGVRSGRWKESFPNCLTIKQFIEHCLRHNKQMAKKNGKYICVNPYDLEVPTRRPLIVITSKPSAKPLTIVTATAGGLLLLLLIVISFVAFQRRRLARNSRRRSHRHRLTDDDRYAFLYYANDFHLVLPSYEEATQGRRPHPPPYLSNTEDSSASHDNPAASIVVAPDAVDLETEDHTYETIDQVLLERSQLEMQQSLESSDDITFLNSMNDDAMEIEYGNMSSDVRAENEPLYASVNKSRDGAPSDDKNDSELDKSDTSSLSSFNFEDNAPLIKEN